MIRFLRTSLCHAIFELFSLSTELNITFYYLHTLHRCSSIFTKLFRSFCGRIQVGLSEISLKAALDFEIEAVLFIE